jgi:hypothetical protein
VEFWSAISAGVLLIVLVGSLWLELLPLWAAPIVAIGGYLAIEAAFRRRLIDLWLRITLFLALIGAIVVVIAWLPVLLVMGVAGIALLAIVDNVRELRS